MSDQVMIRKQSACTIRPPQPEDASRMADLAGQLGYKCSREQVQKRLREMRDGCYAFYVAELPDGQIAGWIGVYIFRSAVLDAFAEINGLVVDENNRSCGIGKLLLDAAEDWARSVGCEYFSVRSNSIRDRAHRFYTNNGFDLIKTQKVFRKPL